MSYPSNNNTNINNELYSNLVTASQFAAYENSVARQLVTVFDAPLNTGLSLQVPVWSSIAADLITDEAAASAKTTNTVSRIITLQEHVVYHQITDQLRDSAYTNVFSQIGEQSGRAIAESMDKQVFSQFANFSSDIGTAGKKLLVSDILKAAATLRAAKLTGPFYAIVHPGSAYSLKANLTATTAYTASTNAGNRVLDGYYVGSIAGVDIYESSLVSTSGNDAVNGVFVSGALGHAMRGTVEMNTLYLPANRATDVVLKAVAGANVLQSGFGVAITADYRIG
jgi:hypothetical protein